MVGQEGAVYKGDQCDTYLSQKARVYVRLQYKEEILRFVKIRKYNQSRSLRTKISPVKNATFRRLSAQYQFLTEATNQTDDLALLITFTYSMFVS